jgi:hypothetical protein
MKNSISKFYIIIFCLCSTFTSFADPGTTDTNGTLEGTDTAPAPIDNYIWVLALIGLVFVFMKLKDIQNKKISIQ